MRLRQVETFIETAPMWAQIAMGLFLVVISIGSIYGRINTKFGAKVFTKIPADQIRTERCVVLNQENRLGRASQPPFRRLRYFARTPVFARGSKAAAGRSGSPAERMKAVRQNFELT